MGASKITAASGKGYHTGGIAAAGIVITNGLAKTSMLEKKNGLIKNCDGFVIVITPRNHNLSVALF